MQTVPDVDHSSSNDEGDLLAVAEYERNEARAPLERLPEPDEDPDAALL